MAGRGVETLPSSLVSQETSGKAYFWRGRTVQEQGTQWPGEEGGGANIPYHNTGKEGSYISLDT